MELFAFPLEISELMCRSEVRDYLYLVHKH
jgi:hypothetical protein